jgi:hypothetical protein
LPPAKAAATSAPPPSGINFVELVRETPEPPQPQADHHDDDEEDVPW